MRLGGQIVTIDRGIGDDLIRPRLDLPDQGGKCSVPVVGDFGGDSHAPRLGPGRKGDNPAQGVGQPLTSTALPAARMVMVTLD